MKTKRERKNFFFFLERKNVTMLRMAAQLYTSHISLVLLESYKTAFRGRQGINCSPFLNTPGRFHSSGQRSLCNVASLSLVQEHTSIWGNPLVLQQRLRSVIVQLFLLSSPAQPMRTIDICALLLNPFYPSVTCATGNSAEGREPILSEVAKGSAHFVLDSTTRYCCVAAGYAIVQYCKGLNEMKRVLPFEREQSFSLCSSGTARHNTKCEGKLNLALEQLVTADEYKNIVHELMEIPSSQLSSIGKKYVTLYDGSLLQLFQMGADLDFRGRTSSEVKKKVRVIPNVEDIVSWMAIGICLSDPFFRPVSNVSWTCDPRQVDKTVATGNRLCSSSHQVPVSVSVMYPLMPSMLLFTWDFDNVWDSFMRQLGVNPKSRNRMTIFKKMASSSNVVYRPAQVLLLALTEYYNARRSAVVNNWTFLHSLYYLTYGCSIISREHQNQNQSFIATSGEISENAWSALLPIWFHLVDHNLPDNFGNNSIPLYEPDERKDFLGNKHCKETEEGNESTLHDKRDTKSLYQQMPHVGVREILYGSAQLKNFIASSSSVGEGGPLTTGATSLRHLFQQLLVQHQHRQSPCGGGFYVTLQRLNGRFIGPLSTSLLLAPISISRLASVLQWHNASGLGMTETGSLFRDHSLLYFLLWVGGHPMLHRLLQREIASARAMEEVRAVIHQDGEQSVSSVVGEQLSAVSDLIPVESCWDYEDEKFTPQVLTGSFELSYLHELFTGAKVLTPPVSIELLAFFLLLPGFGTKTMKEIPMEDTNKLHTSGSSNTVLLKEIRGISLLTLRVVNTSYATPMEAWTAIDQQLRKVIGVESDCHDWKEEAGQEKKRSVQDQWQEMESHIWCLPYSLLKRRFVRLARGWCKQQCRQSRIQNNSKSTNLDTITIRDWAQILLWEKEFGYGFLHYVPGESEGSRRLEVACEMLWAMLFLTDPFQERFIIHSHLSSSTTFQSVGDICVTVVGEG